MFAATTQDVGAALDVFRPVWEASGHVDGRVSIEVSPDLAHDHRGHRRSGQGAVVEDRPPQPPRQDPGHQGRASGDHRGDRDRHQRQRHADLQPGALRRGHRRLPDRSGARTQRRFRPVEHPFRRLVLRVSCRHRDRQAAVGDRHPRGRGAQEQGRARERAPRLRALRAEVRGEARPGPDQARREPAASAVGLDRRQGPRAPPTPCT